MDHDRAVQPALSLRKSRGLAGALTMNGRGPGPGPDPTRRSAPRWPRGRARRIAGAKTGGNLLT